MARSSDLAPICKRVGLIDIRHTLIILSHALIRSLYDSTHTTITMN